MIRIVGSFSSVCVCVLVVQHSTETLFCYSLNIFIVGLKYAHYLCPVHCTPQIIIIIIIIVMEKV